MATHVSVLPRELLEIISADAAAPSLRFVRLPHPRTNLPCLFLPYESAGGQSAILEVQAISPDAERSWFMNGTHVVEDGKLLVYTPIDPAFLLAPLLQLSEPSEGQPGQYLPAEDLFDFVSVRLTIAADTVTTTPAEKANADVLHLLRFRCIGEALRRVCDYKELNEDMTVYRFSRQKLVNYARAKVDHLASPDVFSKFRVLVRGLAKEGLADDIESKKDITTQARLRAACDLVSQYLAPETNATLTAMFDFSALDAYLSTLQDDLFPTTKKTSAAASLPAQEKGTKRKAEKQGSRGVEKLKKANTAGMSKLSSFFQKKP
ncbi:hypothetical protein EXIGLDRAFT_741256 [Exidia glandulosa HHB12029]|uniref:Ribonuclease H2 subunit B n=1 Tax=Exidia glandulosa HHB12029 TaxID=1314781 RepID=A0A165F0E6_EXIGL|nr:hypothetical protein EXIGLDRAFT_653668 [Exidia glandulosa HHB12029]KZV88088.1 hypothetical protein EXIGLDRAFT_741256 [Exidia glandulosa HHB12029]